MYHSIRHNLLQIDKICEHFNIPLITCSLAKFLLIKTYNHHFHYTTTLILATKIKESIISSKDIINYTNKTYKEDINIEEIIKEEIQLTKVLNFNFNINTIEEIYSKILENIKAFKKESKDEHFYKILNNIKLLYNEKLIDYNYTLEDIALTLLDKNELNCFEVLYQLEVNKNQLEEIKKDLEIDKKIC